MAMNRETTTIAKGFIWPSQATVMAVNPTPPAVVSVRVPSEPDTWRKPTRPARAAERNMVRTRIRLTFIPA